MFALTLLTAVSTRVIILVIATAENTIQEITTIFVNIVQPGSLSISIDPWPVHAAFLHNI
jgi:hypothetical protein